MSVMAPTAAALNPDPLWNCEEAADYLGVEERMIRRLVADRKIAYVKIGKYVRLQQSTLDKFVKDNEVPPEE